MKNLQYKIFIASSYFFFYSLLALEFTYVPRYLMDILHFRGQDMSILFAGIPVIGIIAQFVWGELADRCQKTGKILRIITCCAFLCSIPLIFYNSKALIYIIFWLVSFFLTSVSALLDTMIFTRWDMKTYGKIRLWGSMGYGVAALSFSYLLLYQDQFLHSIILLLIGIAFLLFISTLFIGEETRTKTKNKESNFKFISLFKNSYFLLLVIFGVVHYITSGPYNMIFDIYRKSMNLPVYCTGWAISVGIISECLFIAYGSFFVTRLTARCCLILCATLTGIRWFIMSYPLNAIIFISLQAIHGITFGLFFIASVACLINIVPESMRATGQTMFSCIVFSLGGCLGNYMTGYLLDYDRGVFLAFSCCAFISIIAVIISFFIKEKIQEK